MDELAIKSLDALIGFVRSARTLRDTWGEYLVKPGADINLLTGDYPNYLPDFAEFVGDLEQWLVIAKDERNRR